MAKYPEEFLELCRSVTAKRAKTVIDHILKHGHITTEDLKDTYGYDHPPRAARDVREHGIPLETFRVEASNGRKIGLIVSETQPRCASRGLMGGLPFPRN